MSADPRRAPSAPGPAVAESTAAEPTAVDAAREPIGVVVIGRNEGERLRRCLRGLADGPHRVVYVDSNSTDDSVAIARSMGADVVHLDCSAAFTAARARNTGFDRLMEVEPSVRFVQFVDGDCELDEDWLLQGRAALEKDATIAIVCGGLRERSPEASIYNRLGDLEWRKPPGDSPHCGGIFMTRTEVFQRLGGFDPEIAAGEEPDLCCRVRREGWRVVRIDRSMGTHDLAMTRFSQWWRRSVRGGYGALRLTLFGPAVSRGAFRSQVRSAIFWGAALPAAAVAGFVAASLAGQWPWSLALLAVWPVGVIFQGLRLARRAWRRGSKASIAVAYAAFNTLWKYAAIVGFAKCLADRLSARVSRTVTTREFHKSTT